MNQSDDIFFEIHKNLPQEAPGSDEDTLKAMSYINLATENPKILDIGCGPGRQTLTLAKHFTAEITAVDIHQYYLDELNVKIKNAELKSTVKTLNSSMENLPLERESFDLIWSEGAIYIVGFDNGLGAWKKLLKSRGYMVVTEITWLRNDAPRELKTYWNDTYPAMKTVEGNLKAIENHGYATLGHFTLSKKAWEAYYNPLEKRVKNLVKLHKSSPENISVLNDELLEIEIYKKYSDYYGYTFFIIRRDEQKY